MVRPPGLGQSGALSTDMTQFPVCGVSQGRDIASLKKGLLLPGNRVAFCESKYFNQIWTKLAKTIVPLVILAINLLLSKGKKNQMLQ